MTSVESEKHTRVRGEVNDHEHDGSFLLGPPIPSSAIPAAQTATSRLTEAEGILSQVSVSRRYSHRNIVRAKALLYSQQSQLHLLIHHLPSLHDRSSR